MKRIACRLSALLLLLITNSCNLDNFDFGKLSDDVNISPELVAPLAHADITVWDLIEAANEENDTLVKVGDNGIVKIVYTEDNIYNYKVKELLNLPEEEAFSSGDKKVGNIKLKEASGERAISIQQLQDKLSGDIDNIVNGSQTLPAINYSNINEIFEVDPVDEFQNITIASGKLEIQLNNLGLPFSSLSIGGEFYDKNSPSTVLGNFLLQDVHYNDPQTASFDLSNLRISNELNFRLTKFEIIPSGFPENVSLTADLFNVSLIFKDMEISEGRLKVEQQLLEGFNGVFDFSFEDNIKAYEASLKYGNLSVTVNNSSEFTGLLNLSFPSISGETLNAINFSTTGSATMSLANSTIDFTQDQTTPYNAIPYEYSMTINGSNGSYVDFDANQSLSLSVDMKNLDFQTIKGDFGVRTVDIDPDSFNMDTEFFDKIEGDFVLANPVLNLVLTNSIGIPAVVDASFTAHNNSGETANIDTTGLVVQTRSNINSSAVKQFVTFDKTNSNIVNFIALPPSGDINYGGTIRFNTEGPVGHSNPNFFNMDDSLKIDVALDLPFELKVNNLTFQDTADVNGDDFDKVGTAKLTVTAENEIPLDIDVQLFFIDTISGQHFGDAITSGLIERGAPGAAKSSENTITLTQENINNLKKANGILFKGLISSPDEGTQTAVLYSDSKLKMNVIVKSKMDL